MGGIGFFKKVIGLDSESIPSKSSQKEGEKGSRTNQPEVATEARSIGPEDLERLRQGVNQSELNRIRGKSKGNKSPAKWRADGTLTEELKRELGLTISHRGQGRDIKYFLVED